MEGIESPLYKSSEVKIYKDLVLPHHLASIGVNKTVFDQRLGPNDFTNRGPRRLPTAELGGLIEYVRQKILEFSHNSKAMEQPREYKHLGNLPGKESGGEYASNWGFSRQCPKAYKFRNLFNTGKKGNTIFTREGTTDTKSRTRTSSSCQIYGKVPAKIFNILFRKITGRRK